MKLLTKACELYPDGYDFSIIFDTVETLKASHSINRKYDSDVVIQYEDK